MRACEEDIGNSAIGHITGIAGDRLEIAWATHSAFPCITLTNLMLLQDACGASLTRGIEKVDEIIAEQQPGAHMIAIKRLKPERASTWENKVWAPSRLNAKVTLKGLDNMGAPWLLRRRERRSCCCCNWHKCYCCFTASTSHFLSNSMQIWL